MGRSLRGIRRGSFPAIAMAANGVTGWTGGFNRKGEQNVAHMAILMSRWSCTPATGGAPDCRRGGKFADPKGVSHASQAPRCSFLGFDPSSVTPQWSKRRVGEHALHAPAVYDDQW